MTQDSCRTLTNRQGQLSTQRLSEEEHQRLSHLGKNGPRDVEGHRMTHCVPNERRKIVSCPPPRRPTTQPSRLRPARSRRPAEPSRTHRVVSHTRCSVCATPKVVCDWPGGVGEGGVWHVVGAAAHSLGAAVDALRLVDHHVHGASTADLDHAGFEAGLTESAWPAPPGTSHLDSQIGFAVRRWCAPVLDLPPHVDVETYLERRRQLGAAEVTRRLLSASGIGWFLVETGYRAQELLGPSQMAQVAGARAAEIVRLESVAEEVVAGGPDAAGFADAFAAALDERARHAVGLKSVIAYRHGGLDFDPEPPTQAEVGRAAGRWLRDGGRLTDPVLLRHLLWVGVERGLPLQFHVGYGDPDLTLHRCDPSLMTEFLRRVQVPVMLLHCYPYHRTAGYLAAVFPHVHLDVGLAVNHTGARGRAIVAESLEVAPFGKVLFSSDAWGPPELHFLGAMLWRRAMIDVLGGWVASGEWSEADAVRVAGSVGAGNARRVYGLGE